LPKPAAAASLPGARTGDWMHGLIAAFDALMMFLVDSTKSFIVPLIMASFGALCAKTVIRHAPIQPDLKNKMLRVAGIVRDIGIWVILFMFVVLFWVLNYYSRTAPQ
jgi:hypothetical protein